MEEGGAFIKGIKSHPIRVRSGGGGSSLPELASDF